MYEAVNQNPKGIDGPVKSPELVEIIENIRHQNDLAQERSLSIKEKLRSILKWENPELNKISDKHPEQIIDSATDELKYQLKRQKEINDRLGDILLHLKEIV